MSHFDYHLLPGGAPTRSGWFKPVRAVLGLAGVALMSLGSKAAHRLFSNGEDGAMGGEHDVDTDDVFMHDMTPHGKVEDPFVPKDGVDKVMCKSGPPGPLQLLPAGKLGPPALFLYNLQVPDELVKGAHSEVGWVYGAKMAPHGPGFGEVALATGIPSDTLRGHLQTWPEKEFKAKLEFADEWYGYDPHNKDWNSVIRHEVQVVKKDGSTTPAQVYFMPWSSGVLPSPLPPQAAGTNLSTRDYTKLFAPKADTARRYIEEVTKVVSWNIAAINNNPFEYWVDHPDPDYNKLMADVQEFIDKPGNRDVPVSQVFSENMYYQLSGAMSLAGWAEEAGELTTKWMMDFKDRKIISGFLKDKSIGEKRLTSMPDRITNTVRLADGGKSCRPTVINAYEEPLDNGNEWFNKWIKWMFMTELEVPGAHGKVEKKKPYQMLSPIPRAKYPALTASEEDMSLPLQTLCLAIFDAIMVHIMNTVAPGKWGTLKNDLTHALITGKTDRTLQILQGTYGMADVICLQEVGLHFKHDVESSPLHERFQMFFPAQSDPDRDQNSALLLSKEHFNTKNVHDITSDVLARIKGDVPVQKGDLIALAVHDKEEKGEPWLLASFHGDTDGLATVPVLTALVEEADKNYPAHKLIFGLDANTYDRPEPKKKKKNAGPGQNCSVGWFNNAFVELGLTSGWGSKVNAKQYTTSHARTYLQPQLNKAVGLADRFNSPLSDRNPKDFILFRNETWKPFENVRDNTGRTRFFDNIMFPTLEFPSDHAIIASKLSRRRPSAVFRLCTAEQETESQRTGFLHIDKRDRDAGFVHLATKEQIPAVAKKYFPGKQDLRLLTLKAQNLGAYLRWEYSEKEKMTFPHYYNLHLSWASVSFVATVPHHADGSLDFEPLWLIMQ